MTANLRLTFHHVGLACKSIGPERDAHLALGFREEGPVFEDPVQCIRGQFLAQGPFRIELLEPLGPESPLSGHIRRGVKMYHQAFLASSLKDAIERLRVGGAHLLSGPVPAKAFEAKEIAFLALRTSLLVELIQE